MVGVEEGREFRFRGDLYSQESTFPLVANCYTPFTFSFTVYLCYGCMQAGTDGRDGRRRVLSQRRRR